MVRIRQPKKKEESEPVAVVEDPKPIEEVQPKQTDPVPSESIRLVTEQQLIIDRLMTIEEGQNEIRESIIRIDKWLNENLESE